MCNESEYGCSVGGALERKDIEPLLVKMKQGKIKPKHLKWFLGLTEDELDMLSNKIHSGKRLCGGTAEIF